MDVLSRSVGGKLSCVWERERGMCVRDVCVGGGLMIKSFREFGWIKYYLGVYFPVRKHFTCMHRF